MILKRWPILLLTIALLLGFAIFFKRYDSMLVGQVKAFISIAFGFASSCILLSLIWFLQRKPMLESWPNRSSADSQPSMHPGGSYAGSVNSGDQGLRQLSSSTLRTVSSKSDKPPKYEDALDCSEPIQFTATSGRLLEKIAEADACCRTHDKAMMISTSSNIETSSKIMDQNPAGLRTNSETFSDRPRRLGASKNLGRKPALKLATSNSSNSLSGHQQQETDCLCQLDANQLMAMMRASQNQPPKYSEIAQANSIDNESEQSSQPVFRDS